MRTKVIGSRALPPAGRARHDASHAESGGNMGW